MKRENGTYVYDIYTKKPDKNKHAGGIRAVSRETSPNKGNSKDTVWESTRTETGWTTVCRSSKTSADKQPFVRLGDDLI